MLVSPRFAPFSRAGRVTTRVGEIDRSARRRRADVDAEDLGSDGRGCRDGARETSESAARANGGAGRRAKRCGATRHEREYERSASVARAPSRASAHNDGTVTTRGERRGGGAAAVVVDCPRFRLPGGRRVCSAARAQRERSASAARAQRVSARARQHPEASRAHQKPKPSRVHVRRRGRAAQPDAPRPSRSPTRRDSTPRAARSRRRCRRSQKPVTRARSQNYRACAYADA